MKHLPTLLLTVTIFISCQCMAQVISGTYAITNVETGIYLRIKDADTRNGTPIIAYSPVNWKCVTWDFKHIENNFYQLSNLYSGKTFQPKQANPNDGAALEEQPLVSLQPSQLYEFIPDGKEQYLIRLKGTALYITSSDKSGTINAPIILAKKDASKPQHWTLKEQHPEM